MSGVVVKVLLGAMRGVDMVAVFAVTGSSNKGKFIKNGALLGTIITRN
jgi:hypothetical protein